MLRALPALTGLLLLAPTAAASAAPFGELPFRSVGGTATCLRATGLPGELVRSTRTGAQFLQAGPAGLTPGFDLDSEAMSPSCPQVASGANGAGVVAFAAYVENQSESFIRAALREPGGTWNALSDLAEVPTFPSGQPIAVASSERGDAVVAFAARDTKRRIAISAVVRAPGGVFGAPQAFFTTPVGTTEAIRVAAGVSASGEVVVAWSMQPAKGKPREVWAAIAAPGVPFGSPAKIGALRAGAPFSLAVGAGGHALLVFPSGDDLLVAERGPGAGFGTAARVAAASDPLVVLPTVAVRADGGAIVAWNNGLKGDAQAVVRAQPGAFSAPLTILPKSGLRFPKSLLDLVSALSTDDSGEFTSGGAGVDSDGGLPRATIAPDGRAVVTVAGITRRSGLWSSAPTVVTVPLAGGAPEHHFFGSELRDVGTITPVVTTEAKVGIAWADNYGDGRDGRLHLALEGSPDGADPAAPEITIIAPKRRVLRADEELRFAIRCSAACDLRVQLGTGLLAPTANASLTHAGQREIRLFSFFTPLATLRGGPVKLDVRYGAPGTRHAAAKTATFDLRRLPDAPLPRVLEPVARRAGDDVVVTWHTDRDAKPSDFAVFGTSQRGTDSVAGFVPGQVKRSGRSFTTRLEHAEKVRYVTIIVSAKGARKTKTTRVRVRG